VKEIDYGNDNNDDDDDNNDDSDDVRLGKKKNG
jgi:hypothetical protein